MSDIEKLFLAAYPLWPKALLGKYSKLLSLEIAKFNPEINLEIHSQYEALNFSVNIVVGFFQKLDFKILNPKNQRFITKYNISNGPRSLSQQALSVIPQFDSLISAWGLLTGYIYYDNRLFSVNPSGIFFDFHEWPTDGLLYLKFSAMSLVVQPYNGAESVLAMIENGVTVNVDLELLSEFVTFLNAYNKYSGAMAATNALQAEKNRQTLTDYKNAMSEKLSNRKNSLGDLKTQISFAAKNETASAKRDMQGLLLSGQSLMIQLQDRLGQL